MSTIARTTSSVNWRVGAPVADPAVAYEQFRLGWDYYTARESYASCANAEQRRGYLAANASEAESTIGGFADRAGF